MPYQAEELAGLIGTCIKNLGRAKWLDLTTSLQEYFILPMVLDQKKVRFDDPGIGIQYNIVTATSGQARNTKLWDSDQTVQTDHFKQATVPWRHSTASYAFETREQALNSGDDTKILDLVKVRRNNMMVDLANLVEDDYWSKPASSSDDMKVFGLRYWITYGGDADNKQSTARNFTGGNPDGFSAGAGGVSSTDVPRWSNFSRGYKSVTKADLVQSMRIGHLSTQFKAPVVSPTYQRGRNTCEYFTNQAVYLDFANIGESQNQNLGNDLASKDDQMVFRRCPIYYVPKLDEDTNNPIFGINWSWFAPAFVRGWYMKEDKPRVVGNAHNQIVVHMDMSHNLVCYNRRAQQFYQKKAA
jgi:hypothetical protein